LVNDIAGAWAGLGEVKLRSFCPNEASGAICCCWGKGLNPAGFAIGGPLAGPPSKLLLPEGPNDRLLARLARLLSRSPVNTLAPSSLDPLVAPTPPLGCITSPNTAPDTDEAAEVG